MTLGLMEVISPATAIKAIEMKHKLFNGAQVAIRSTAWKEIKVHEAAREQAITIAILEFIPMEQYDAVTQRMEDVTRAYYDSIGLEVKHAGRWRP